MVAIALTASPVLAQAPPPKSYSFLDTVRESLFGDVYSDPSRWRPLTLEGLFTEGWNRPWVSPPAGEGGAPRQGWLNSFDGVFYRLAVGGGSFAHNFNDNGNQYSGAFTVYAPFSARFEVRLDVPFIVSNKVESDNDYHTHFGDIQITPEVLITESRNFSQLFAVAMRIPTGDKDNGNGFAAMTPTWQFWWNAWSKLVVRGGLGFQLPYTESDRTRNNFLANLAVGYYFTPHDLTPFGDFVFYVSTNLTKPVDDRGSNDPTLSFSPGIRTHLGANWYFLGAVEVPTTTPKPFDYQLTLAVMKVY